MIAWLGSVPFEITPLDSESLSTAIIIEQPAFSSLFILVYVLSVNLDTDNPAISSKRPILYRDVPVSFSQP